MRIANITAGASGGATGAGELFEAKRAPSTAGRYRGPDDPDHSRALPLLKLQF